MKQNPLVTTRFEELTTAASKVLATKRSDEWGATWVDAEQAETWAVSSLSFIGRTLGRESEHYQRFKEHSEAIGDGFHASQAAAVLRAAFEDYKGGYLFDLSKLIHAEIFDDLLEQSEYFLKEGYHGVAAVMAGAVLEDTLRRLCGSNGILLPPHPKLDSMNADLAKQGVYDKLVQKRITHLADIRNKAAHGKWAEFTTADTEDMLRGVRRFAENFA